MHSCSPRQCWFSGCYAVWLFVFSSFCVLDITSDFFKSKLHEYSLHKSAKVKCLCLLINNFMEIKSARGCKLALGL